MAIKKVKKQQAYGLSSPIVNILSDPIISSRAPTTSDVALMGQMWIDSSTNKSYQYTSKATWTELTATGSAGISTLEGDSGGAISPDGTGNLTITGGTNITTAGAANAITFNLDDAISLATSVTTPSLIGAAGAEILITPAAGRSVTIRTGDDGGAAGILFENYAGASIGSINSFFGSSELTMNSFNASTNYYMQSTTTFDVAAGANAAAGTATLVAGTVTIAHTSVSAGSVIVVVHGGLNASTAVGVLQSVPGAGTFTINSLNSTGAVETNDVSDISYWIVNVL